MRNEPLLACGEGHPWRNESKFVCTAPAEDRPFGHGAVLNQQSDRIVPLHSCNVLVHERSRDLSLHLVHRQVFPHACEGACPDACIREGVQHMHCKVIFLAPDSPCSLYPGALNRKPWSLRYKLRAVQDYEDPYSHLHV